MFDWVNEVCGKKCFWTSGPFTTTEVDPLLAITKNVNLRCLNTDAAFEIHCLYTVYGAYFKRLLSCIIVDAFLELEPN